MAGWIILALAISTICGFITLFVYNHKGYDGGYFLGFLLGIIGVIIALCLPGRNIKHKEEVKTVQYNTIESEGENIRICKDCGNQLFDNENKCSNCGQEIENANKK